MKDYINGNKFAKMAHFVIHPPNFSYKILKKDAIIFCKTDYLEFLFENLKFSNRNYILITHASDFPINAERFSKKPPCIKKWFAENAKYDHLNLIPVPIGIENHIEENGCGKGTHIEENLKILTNKQEYFKKKKKIEDTIFCSFRINYHFASGVWTNPFRKNIISNLEHKGVKYFKPDTLLSFGDFCESLTNYKFVISPPGNGIDTHRTWEALYIGCIPIVLKDRIYKFYNLPILQVEKWTDITQELLSNYIEEIKDNNFNNYEELDMIYWKNKIMNEFNKLKYL